MNKILKILEKLCLLFVSANLIVLSVVEYNRNNYAFAIFDAVVGIMFLFITIEVALSKDYKRIKIVYHIDGMEKIKKISQGDWIDLRAAEDVELKTGEFKLINLGVSMKLPDGYEAYIAPRSSTYKNFHIIQANNLGVVDNSYSGTNDVWKFPALATEDTVIHKNDRICQFRIMPIQPKVCFIETDRLDGNDRGGFGSTEK